MLRLVSSDGPFAYNPDSAVVAPQTGSGMSRAGREPAEDVKRRLAAACQEAGLYVSSANMILLKEKEARLINVAAGPEHWPHLRALGHELAKSAVRVVPA